MKDADRHFGQDGDAELQQIHKKFHFYNQMKNEDPRMRTRVRPVLMLTLRNKPASA